MKRIIGKGSDDGDGFGGFVNTGGASVRKDAMIGQEERKAGAIDIDAAEGRQCRRFARWSAHEGGRISGIAARGGIHAGAAVWLVAYGGFRCDGWFRFGLRFRNARQTAARFPAATRSALAMMLLFLGHRSRCGRNRGRRDAFMTDRDYHGNRQQQPAGVAIDPRIVGAGSHQ